MSNSIKFQISFGAGVERAFEDTGWHRRVSGNSRMHSVDGRRRRGKGGNLDSFGEMRDALP